MKMTLVHFELVAHSQMERNRDRMIQDTFINVLIFQRTYRISVSYTNLQMKIDIILESVVMKNNQRSITCTIINREYATIFTRIHSLMGLAYICSWKLS